MKKILIVWVLLLAHQICVGITPLYEAAMQGNLERVKMLIAQGNLVNERNKFRAEYEDAWGGDPEEGLTPMYGALNSKNTDVIDFLIQSGADLNAYGSSTHPWPLYEAAQSSLQVFEKLLLNGARKGYEESLSFMVLRSHIDTLKKALEFRTKLDVENDLLSRLLIDAVRSYWAIPLEKIDLLVELGADVNYVVPFDKTQSFNPDAGKTPLHFLAEYKGASWSSSELAQYDESSRRGILDRRLKVKQNKSDIAKILITHGAKPSNILFFQESNPFFN